MKRVTRLRLRVVPGAARSEIVGPHGEGWKLRVAAPAERGRANDAVRDLLATALGVPRDAVTIVAGGASRDKVVEIVGLTDDDAARSLAAQERKGDR